MKLITSILALSGLFSMALGAALPDADIAPEPEAVNESTMACTGGKTKCAGGNPGGAVFKCNNGSWIVMQACRSFESCKDSPVPHCTWAAPKQDGLIDADFNVIDVEPEYVSNTA